MGRVIAVPVSVTAAGSINVAAAPGSGKQNVLHGFVISQTANGTIKAVSDAGGTPVELTGALSVLAAFPLNTRFVTPLVCGTDKTLDLVTTGGNTAGVVFYSIEDA